MFVTLARNLLSNKSRILSLSLLGRIRLLGEALSGIRRIQVADTQSFDHPPGIATPGRDQSRDRAACLPFRHAPVGPGARFLD
jgi:hypothetical protein